MGKGKYVAWLEPDNLLRLAGWARDGLSDEQIAHNIGINRDTLYTWKLKHPDISDALKKGKDVVDMEVENALHKKALGYNIFVTKNFKVKRTVYNEKGYKCEEYEELITAQDEIHVPADTTAQIFWLKNRKPEEWRDRKELNHSGEMGVEVAQKADPAQVVAEYMPAVLAALASNDASE